MGSGVGNYIRICSIIKPNTTIIMTKNYSINILKKIIKYVKKKMNVNLNISYREKQKLYLINKGGTLKNLCLRGVYLSKKFSKTQNKQTLVYLRAPKHFNIGKQEVLSFRNKFSHYYKPD